MKTLQDIIKGAPRASFARPRIVVDDLDPRRVTATLGSPADAVRAIEAVRQAGYFARLDDAREPRKIAAATVEFLI